MRHVPEDIQSYYREKLKSVSEEKRYNYVKWIRYYLDFCSRYSFTPYEKSSFSHFSQKLSDKGQTIDAIEEAYQAVELLLPFYRSGLNEGELENGTEVIRQLVSIIREKNYSPRTLEAYVKWSRELLRFHKGTIAEIDDGVVRKFLNYLVVQRNVSPSAHDQAFNALLFLFRHILKRDFGDQSGNIRSKRPGKKIPVVFTIPEIELFIQQVETYYSLHFLLMYGCGLRLSELVSLRLKDIDFENNSISVNQAKGQKNRILPLPKRVKEKLRLQVLTARTLHFKNCEKSSYAGVFLPQSIAPTEARKEEWVWLFPASRTVKDREDSREKQYHLHH